MPVDITSTLREALAKLTAEKRRIERQAAAIQEALRAVKRNWWCATLIERRSDDARSKAKPPADECNYPKGDQRQNEGVLGEAPRWNEQGQDEESIS